MPTPYLRPALLYRATALALVGLLLAPLAASGAPAASESLASQFDRAVARLGAELIAGAPVGHPVRERSQETGAERWTRYYDGLVLELRADDPSESTVWIRQAGKAALRYRAVPAGIPPEADERAAWFPETGQAVRPPFLEYFLAGGGESVLGPPVSGVIPERDAGSGEPIQVQYFTHARLEQTHDGSVRPGQLGRQAWEWRPRLPAPIGAMPLRAGQAARGFNVYALGEVTGPALDAATTAHATWVRQQLAWRDLEPAPGFYQWQQADALVEAARQRHLHLLLSLVWAPPWATRQARGIPDDPAALGRFLLAMASRYRGRVAAYEIWNEPNLRLEVGDINPEQFVGLMQAGYTAVKVADPNAIVVFGSVSATAGAGTEAMGDLAFLDRVYQVRQGAVRTYFDALGYHPGGQINPPDSLWPEAPGPGPRWQNDPTFYFRRVEQVHRLMESYGDGDKQIWLTEFGWPTPGANDQREYWVSEDHQAEYLLGAFARAEKWYPWMGPLFVWNLNFAQVVPRWDEKAAWSVIRADGSPRPAFLALSALASAQ